MFARNIWWSKLPQKFWWNKGWIIAQPQSPGCRDAPLTLGTGRPSSAAFWSIERVELAAESVGEGKSLWLAVLKQITEQEEKRKEKKESPPSLSPEHARFHPFTAAALDFSCHLQLSIRRTPHQKWLHYVWGGEKLLYGNKFHIFHLLVSLFEWRLQTNAAWRYGEILPVVQVQNVS